SSWLNTSAASVQFHRAKKPSLFQFFPCVGLAFFAPLRERLPIDCRSRRRCQSRIPAESPLHIPSRRHSEIALVAWPDQPADTILPSQTDRASPCGRLAARRLL